MSRYLAHFLEDAGGTIVTDDFSLDAVLLRTQSVSITLDAVIQKEQTGSYGLDAVLVVTSAATFSADAVIQKTQSVGAAFDAVVFKTQSASADLDAFIAEEAVVDDFSLDAVISAVVSDGFGFDAYLAGTGHSRLDSHFGTQDDTTITVDGELLRDVLTDLFDQAYGIQVPSGRFGLDAFIHPYLMLDAVLLKTQAGSFGLDARIGGSGSFSLNAIVFDVIDQRFGLDAYILGA